MENELKPRELTKDLIRNMRQSNDPQAKFYGTLQVLSVRDDSSYITVSDGYSFSEVALFKSIRDKVKTSELKINDIIYVSMLLHKASIDVMVTFDKLYSNVSKKIGNPVPFSTYQERNFTNPDGLCDIPRYLWEEKKPAAAAAGPKPESQATGSLRPLTRTDEDEVHQIATLSTGSTEFIVKAKVLSKSNRREYNQGKGKSSLFNIVIADASDSIQCTFFSAAADKFYDEIQQGRVYLFMNGEVRKGGKYNNCKNPNEIYFSPKSQIIECPGATIEVSTKFDFKKIGQIQNEPLHSTVDLIGIISGIGEKANITLKTGGSKAKQTFKVRDDSNFEIEVNLWGEYTECSGIKEGDTVIFNNLLVAEFNHSRVLNSKADQTKIISDPSHHLPQVQDLEKWKAGDQEGIKSLRQEKKSKDNLVITIDQLKRETQFMDKDNLNKQLYTITAYVTAFGQTNTYQKCPIADCYKKATVEDNGNGDSGSHCTVHGFTQQPPVPKFIGNIKVTDHTDSLYLNFTTDQVGKIIFGCDAQEIQDKAAKKDDLTDYLNHRTKLKYTFKLSLKYDTYQNQEKIKYNIINCYDQVGNRLHYENKALLYTILKLQDEVI